jgi:tetratricopeptide (TPR) repeat protein
MMMMMMTKVPAILSSGSLTRIEIDDASDYSTERAISLKESGNSLLTKGDLLGALEAYSASLELDPNMIASRNNRSLVHLKLNMLDEAVADASIVLESEPSNVKALYRKACA